jgi:hypothetical protein
MQSQQNDRAAQDRAPYQPPTLTRYGAVRDLTAAGTFGRAEAYTMVSDPMTRM